MKKCFNGFLLVVSISGILSLYAQTDDGHKSATELLWMVGRKEITISQLCQRLRGMTADEKKRIAPELKEILNNPHIANGTPASDDLTLFLLVIGDEETIKKSVRLYRDASYGDDDLKNSRNPAVIAAMGDDLMRENRDRTTSDVIIMGIASNAWTMIRSILLSVPEFSAELKEWVKNGPIEVGEPAEDADSRVAIGILQQWWKVNRATFKAGQYSEVKPGTAWPSIWKQRADMLEAARQETARQAAEMHKAAKSGRINPTESLHALPPASVPSLAETKVSVFEGYGIYAGLAGLVACIVFYFRKRLFRKP